MGMVGLGMLWPAARAEPLGAQAASATVGSPGAASAIAVPPGGASANAAPATVASAREEYLRGQALFSGTVELHGRIYTHMADLPPMVVRCSNCHAVADGPDVPRSLAPRLTHDLLLRRRARRGGPPSNYDRDGLCTLLRRGVDPAFVLISVEMPRYTIDDVSCRALWRYLTGSGHEDNGR
jgi:hypothetical protein